MARLCATAIGSDKVPVVTLWSGSVRDKVVCWERPDRLEESMRLSTRLRVLAASLGLSLLLVGSAPAQSPSSPPSPDTLAAAHELLEAMHAADIVKNFLPTVMTAMKPAIVQNRPDVERDYDAIMPLLLKRANERLDEMLDRMAPIYAKNFTVAELKDITAFYRSPTGQKLIARLPNISKESFAVGQQFGREIAAELHTSVIEELRKRGHTIGDPATAH
jgi:hypothetical protein